MSDLNYGKTIPNMMFRAEELQNTAIQERVSHNQVLQNTVHTMSFLDMLPDSTYKGFQPNMSCLDVISYTGSPYQSNSVNVMPAQENSQSHVRAQTIYTENLPQDKIMYNIHKEMPPSAEQLGLQDLYVLYCKQGKYFPHWILDINYFPKVLFQIKNTATTWTSSHMNDLFT